MVATKNGRVIRLNWNGIEERDYALDLKRIPFSINQQVSYGKELSLLKAKINMMKLTFFFLSRSNTGEQHIH